MLLERCDGSAPLQRTEFLLTEPGPARLVAQTERGTAGPRLAAEYQVGTAAAAAAAADGLARPREERGLPGMPMRRLPRQPSCLGSSYRLNRPLAS